MGRRTSKTKRRLEKTVNVSRTIFELMEWFRTRRAGLRQPGPSLRLSVFPNIGRGLMALSTLKPNDVLISIPLRFMITREKVENSLKSDRTNELTTHHLISVFLLRELDKGSNSFWLPYLKTLPDSFDVPFFCSSTEIDSTPFYVKQKCLAQQKIVLSAFEKVRLTLNINLDLQRFSWAWFAVNTRAVYFENDSGRRKDETEKENVDLRSENNLALAPYLDMFNHASDVAVSVGRAVSSEFAEGVYQIVSSNKTYRKYDQVFINYGPHDNLKLCLEYGFVLDDNPNDLVPISLEELLLTIPNKNRSDGRISKALDFIRCQSLNINLGFIPGPEMITWNLSACLFVLAYYSRPETWSKIYSLDVESLIKIAEVRAGLFIILSLKLEELETFLKTTFNNTTIEKPTLETCLKTSFDKPTESFLVIRRLVEIHRDMLTDSLKVIQENNSPIS